MYLSHFNLKKNPFKTDPEFLWLGDKYKEALETLRDGILHNDGCVVMTGEIGTGKTTLANALVNDFGDNIVVAKIPHPEIDTLDFFKSISTAYGIDANFQSREPFLVHFASFLRRCFSTGKKVVLIVDEAQRLSHEHLKELLHLTTIEQDGTGLLNIVFIGENEFNTILLEESNQALRQRVAVNYTLSALTQEETSQYITHRLKVAQCEREIFTSEAIQDIFRFSKGNPRMINMVCDLALLITYSQGGHRVQSETVKQCMERLRLRNEKSEFDWAGTDRSPGMEREGGTEILAAIRDRINPEKVREKARKPAWVRGAYAAAFGYLLVLSGLFFLLHQHGRVQPHSTHADSEKEGIKESGMTQAEMESLKLKESSGAKSLATKELPLSQGTVKGSDSSAQRERPSGPEKSRTSKEASVRSPKSESQKEIGSKTSVEAAKPAITNLSLQERSSNDIEKVPQDKPESASQDESGGLSQGSKVTTERSARETSSKDKEEVDPAKAIDWLLEKRGDRK